jgi:integration host factor subunit alpha
MKTVTRSDIAESICEQIGLSRKDAGEILDMVIEEIRSELIAGKDVKIAKFGSFLLKHKNARIGRNPKTGVEAEISPRTVISFRPSTNLKTAVNK